MLLKLVVVILDTLLHDQVAEIAAEAMAMPASATFQLAQSAHDDDCTHTSRSSGLL